MTVFVACSETPFIALVALRNSKMGFFALIEIAMYNFL